MPKTPVYGKNLTIIIQGLWHGKTEKGIGFSATIWYDNIPDPVYKTSRRRDVDCSKHIKKPSKSNWIFLNTNDNGRLWLQTLACSFKDGRYVKKFIAVPFKVYQHGNKIPGSLFSSGWYRIQAKFFDQYDEEFLCIEGKGYIKMTT